MSSNRPTTWTAWGSSPTSSSASRSAVRSRSSSSGSAAAGEAHLAGVVRQVVGPLGEQHVVLTGSAFDNGHHDRRLAVLAGDRLRVVVRDPVELHAGSVGGHGLNSLGDGFATEAWGESRYLPVMDVSENDFRGDGFALSFDELVRK